MMKNKVRLWVLGFAFFLISIVVTSLSVINTSRAVGSSLLQNVVDKTYYYALSQCFKDGNVNHEVSTVNWAGVSGVTGNNPGLLPTKSSNDYTILDSDLQAKKTNCINILLSDTIRSRGPEYGADPVEVGEFLKKTGYEPAKQTETDQKCATFEFVRGASTSTSTLCVNVNGNGKVLPPSSGYEYRAASAGTTEAVEISLGQTVSDYYGLSMVFNTTSDADNIALSTCFAQPALGRCALYAFDNPPIVINPDITEGITFDELIKRIESGIQEIRANDDTTGFRWNRTSTKIMSSNTTPTEYVLISDSTKRANDAINAFSGGTYKSTDAVGLNNNENVAYLQQQLINYYGFSYYYDKEQACNPNIKTEDIPSDFVKVYFNADNACYIKGPKEHAKDKVSVPSCFKNTCYINSQTADYDGVIALLNQYAKNAHDSSLNPPDGTGVNPGENDFDGSDPGSSSDGENGPSNSDQPLCYDAGGTLGWIICPVLEGLGDATEFLYNTFIEKMLSINPELIGATNGSGGDGATYFGWSIIRGFANTLFAIAFVIVILAQVTGIGISNYNIKKILPRLIMVVVLVNLSFIICQLAVDVSNILGSGLKDLFGTQLVGELDKMGVSTSRPHTIGNIVSGILVALGIGGTVALGVNLPDWRLWIFPILLAIGGVLIGVLFFFILLGVRQAGVIILIVLAPVAIVCYALPNTKSFFDRWRKMFTALLVLYPICGLVIGGGQFAAKLLVSVNAGEDENFFFILVAMLLQVVPFFMIPSMVRSSMSMIGNIGDKITGFGRRFNGGLQNRIRGTRAFRNQQELARQVSDRRYYNRAYKRAQNRYDKLKGKEPKTWIGRQRLSRAELALNNSSRRRLQDIGAASYASSAASRIDDETFNNELQGFASELENGAYVGADGKIVNASDMNALNNAHLAALNASLDVNASDEARRTARARVAALEDRMMKVKADDAVDRITSNYINSSAKADHNATINQGAYAGAISAGYRRAAERFNSNFGGDVVRYGGKGTAVAMGSLGQGDYASVATNYGHQIQSRDGSRNNVSYSENGLADTIRSMTAQGLNDLSDDNIARIQYAIDNGQLDARSIDTLSRVFNEYRTNNNIAKKDSVLARIQDLQDSMFGSSRNMTGVTAGAMNPQNPTLGAQAMRNMTSEQRAAITDQIENTDWSAMGSVDDVQRRIDLLANAQYALQNYGSSMTSDEYFSLNNAFNKAYRSMGNINGGITGYDRTRLDSVYNSVQGDDRRALEAGEGTVFKPDRDGKTTVAQEMSMPGDWAEVDGVWYDRSRPVLHNVNGRMVGGYERLSAEQAAEAKMISEHNAKARVEQRQRQQRQQRQQGGNPSP